MTYAYTPGPTGAAFLASTAHLKLICGPVGGGKSTVALMDLVHRAIEQAPFDGVRRTKFAIVRNTAAQLKSTVKPLIDTWLVTMTQGRMGKWRLTENVFEIRVKLGDGTVVHSELLLMPCDTPDDVRRLLSLEVSAAWVEECREIDPEVFNTLQTRVNRFPAKIAGGVTRPGVICSTNPPPHGGFWHEFMTEPGRKTEIFMQPPALLDDDTLNPDAENLENLAASYYDDLVEGKTEDWINVYLKNKFGAGANGRPLYRASFKRSFHVSEEPLHAVIAGINPLIVGMDNGLQAAAAVLQQDARGRVNILAEAFVPEDETMGVESFLDRLLIPVLRNKFPTVPNDKVLFVLDPACFARSQLNEATIAQAVGRRGYKAIQACTNDPEQRISAVEQLLTRQIDGKAGLLIDPECRHIISALEWGHRYKRTAAGVHTTDVEKNHFSHIGDAVQYGALHYNAQLRGSPATASRAARKVVPSSYCYV